jgi:cyclopropane-fatty-acyl-phospholipid synthase
MPAKGVETKDWKIKASLAFLENLLGDYRPRDFAVRLWDGTRWDSEPGRPARFTLVLKHPGALRSMFWPPSEISLAEAYIYDDFDIEGGIEDVFGLADHLLTRRRSPAERLLQARRVLSLPAGRGDGRARTGREAARLRGARHSRERDRRAVTYHYDVPGEFYALWLDERMVYSCAYFAAPEEDLDSAQERKLDYICRKLRLRPGERLLDIGCGWGGLIIHAAHRYGVRALGITLSEPQAELANERIRRAGG